MASNVVINVKATTRQATSELDKLKKSFADLTTTKGWKNLVTGVGVGAGVAGFNALTSAVRGTGAAIAEGVRDAAEEEAGIARLTAALKANVPAWDGATDAIEATIASRRKLAFSDDDLRASFAQIVAATHDVSAAFAVQQTAMDLARLKGIDLGTASEALIKVEAGQYRVLKSLGIVLKDGATQTEALAAVQRVAAGQAQAYADSSAGALFQLNDSLKELNETIGKNLLPVIEPLVRWMTDLAEAAGDNETGLGRLVRVLELLAGGFGGTSEAAGNLRAEAQKTGLFWKLTGQTIAEAGDDTAGAAVQLDGATRAASGATDTFTSLGLAAARTGYTMTGAITTGASAASGALASVDTRGVGATGVMQTLAERVAALQTRFTELTSASDTAAGSLANAGASAQAGTDAVRSAIGNLDDALRSETSVAGRLGQLGGILYGKKLADGLKSKDPDVKAAAVALRNTVIAEFERITGVSYSIGAAAAAAMANGIAALIERASRMNETFTTEELDRLRRQAAEWRKLEEELRNKSGAGNAYTPPASGGSSGENPVATARAAAAAIANLGSMVARVRATMASGWTPTLISAATAQTRLTTASTKFNTAVAALRVGSASSLAAVRTAFNGMKQAALNYYDAVHRERVASLQGAIDAITAERDARRRTDLEEAARNARGVYTNPLDQQIADLEAAATQRARIEEEQRLRLAVSSARTNADRRDAQGALDDFLARAALEDLRAQRDKETAIRDADQALADYRDDQRSEELRKQIAAADEQYNAQVAALNKLADATIKGLDGVKSIWTTKNAATLKILNGFKDDFKEAGRALYRAFATGLNGPALTVSVPAITSAVTPSGARASGGPVAAGRTYLVGERGPEYLTMGSQPGFVTPTAGGGQPVVVQLNLDGRKVAELVDERLYYRYRTAARGALA